MDRTAEPEAVVVPAAALVLASGSAVALCAAARLAASAELLFPLLWLVGWALLVWAALLGGGHAVLLGVRARSRQPVLRREIVLTASALLLVVAVVAVNPLFGSGGAAG